MYNLNLECGLSNAEAMGLCGLILTLLILLFWEGEEEIWKWSPLFFKPPAFVFLIKVSCELVNIVGGLHGIMDVKVQTLHLEYSCSLDEQRLVFFYLVGDFLGTCLVSCVDLIIGVCYYYPYVCLLPPGPEFCFSLLIESKP